MQGDFCQINRSILEILYILYQIQLSKTLFIIKQKIKKVSLNKFIS